MRHLSTVSASWHNVTAPRRSPLTYELTPELHGTTLTTMANANGTAGATELYTTGAIGELLLRVEGEYREMPGLSLTVPQAERLWGLDASTCASVLTALIERRVLTRTASKAYLRRSAG